MADRFAVAPLLIPIAASFHVSLAAVSGAASLYYLAYGLMPPLYGVLSDRFGRVRVIRAALVGTALADALSALSPNLTALLIARFVTGGIACGVFPTTLVYLGDRFPFKVRQHAITNVLVFVALGHYERKGLPLLFEALRALNDSRLKMVVVGGSQNGIAAYRERANKGGLNGNVKFLQTQKDIRPYLWAADALTLPSHYEVFPLAVLEAAAAGLPLPWVIPRS